MEITTATQRMVRSLLVPGYKVVVDVSGLVHEVIVPRGCPKDPPVMP